jgi:hypothetical protein
MTSSEKLVTYLKRTAERGLYFGLLDTPDRRAYFEACTGYHPHTGTALIFTRDSGHHSSGWFRNPDYERCYHLSLSFRDPETGAYAPFNPRLAARWVKLFFGDNRRLLWCEPPYSASGRQVDCWHYRLFCDPGWQPLKPRGEVYSHEFTEQGWQSFSEIHGADAPAAEFAWGDPR